VEATDGVSDARLVRGVRARGGAADGLASVRREGDAQLAER
jgi:hypothetical protein